MNPEPDQNNLISQPSSSGNQSAAHNSPSLTPPVSPGQLSPTPAKKNSKTIFIALIVLVLIAALGAVAYITLRPKDQGSNQATNQAINSLTEGLHTNQASTEFKTTTFTSHDMDSINPITIAIDHPTDWRVERGDSEVHGGITVSGELKIISPAGNVLYLTDRSIGGAGGWCEGDIGLVLTKRINTRDQEYAFYQYGESPEASVSSAPGVNELLFVAHLGPRARSADESKSIEQYNGLQEGEQLVGHCSIFDRPSMIKSGNDQPDQGRIYPSIVNEAMQGLGYDSVKNDAAFIAMLESMRVE